MPGDPRPPPSGSLFLPDHPDAYAAVRGSVASSSTTPGTATRQDCPSLTSPRVCPSSHPVSLSAEGPTKLLLWEPPGLGHSSPPGRSGPPSRGREPRGPGPRLLLGLEGRAPQAEAEAQGPPGREGPAGRGGGSGSPGAGVGTAVTRSLSAAVTQFPHSAAPAPRAEQRGKARPPADPKGAPPSCGPATLSLCSSSSCKPEAYPDPAPRRTPASACQRARV